MKKSLLGGLGFLVLAGVASAAPQCVTVENIDVNTLTGGCIVGEYLFNNFLWDAAGIGTTEGPVVISGIFSDPADSTFGLTFNPNLVGAPNLPADIHLTFSVSNSDGSNNPDVYEVGVVVPGGPTNTGTGTHVQENGCTTPMGQDSGACGGTPLFSVSAFAGQTVPLQQVTPVPVVWIWKNLNASDPRLPVSQLTSFTELFHAPEPATFATFGAALLALGLARRKRK